jgi:hypothetical protein
VKKSDRVFHRLTGDRFTVDRITKSALISNGKSYPIGECELAQAALSAADIETLMGIVQVGIELRDPEVLDMLNELSIECKKELWISHLSPEQRSALGELKAARSGVAA